MRQEKVNYYLRVGRWMPKNAALAVFQDHALLARFLALRRRQRRFDYDSFACLSTKKR